MAEPTPNNSSINLSSKYIGNCVVCKTLVFFEHKEDFVSFSTDPYCDGECVLLALENLSCTDSTPDNKSTQ